MTGILSHCPMISKAAKHTHDTNTEDHKTYNTDWLNHTHIWFVTRHDTASREYFWLTRALGTAQRLLLIGRWMHKDKPDGSMLLRSLPPWRLSIFASHVNTKTVLQYIHHYNKHRGRDHRTDGHKSKWSRNHFMNFELTWFYFAITTRETTTQAVTRIILRHRATHTIVQTYHVATIIHRCFTVCALPVRWTRTTVSIVRCFIANTYQQRDRLVLLQKSRSEMLTVIQASVSLARPTIAFAPVSMKAGAARTAVEIRGVIGITAGSFVFTWL